MLVSIITPFYFGNAYLPALLTSIQKNAVRSGKHNIQIEHILINDSPEQEVALPDMQCDFAVRVVANKENLGIHASRIRGVHEAKGRYLIFLDQDDTLEELAVLSHLQTFRKSVAPADVSVGNGYKVDVVTGEKEKLYRRKSYHALCGRIGAVIRYGTIIISPGQCMIKKDAIPNAWLTNPIAINGADDEILWMAMLQSASCFAVNPYTVYNHMENGSNTSENVDQMARSAMEGVRILEAVGGISKRQLEQFIRRRKMKQERYQKNSFIKLLVNVKYLDLSLYVFLVKIIKG